jgi:alkylation response protein AidB-like acyl-CoA dehydrogenase
VRASHVTIAVTAVRHGKGHAAEFPGVRLTIGEAAILITANEARRMVQKLEDAIRAADAMAREAGGWG